MSTFKLAEDHQLEPSMMRDTYCQTMLQLAEKDKRVVMLDADLMSSMGTIPFMEKYPERTFNVGVQEANMIGMAAGMSATGLIPYAHTFGPFASRRCFDQLFLSVGYSKLNVRVIGSDPGITAAYNGGTHMPFEDMGIIRNIPEAIILEPVDSAMLSDLLIQSKDIHGLVYIRLLRKNAIKIYEEGATFDIGKGVTLIEGSDVTIIATGIMVKEALDAAEMLKEEGISARVVNIFTLKPIDKELIIKCAKETGAIVTAENHNIINGLGSAVAEVLGENIPVPLERVGVKDLFGEVGAVEYLRERFELTAEEIVIKCKKVVGRK
jgi:transketolase